MNIKLELLKKHIADYVVNNLEIFEIDASEVADTVAIAMLSEIQKVLRNENYSDFEAVEEIVCIFEKHKIDCGSCHSF